MLIAAIGTAIAIGKKLWDVFTLNADEAKQKTEAWSQAVREAIQQMNKEHEEVDRLITSFIQLNTILPKTLSNFNAQLMILKSLQSIYGNLGVEVDKTKKQFEGLLNALIQIEKIKHQQKKDAYTQKLKNAELAAHQAHTEFYDENALAFKKNQLIKDFQGKQTKVHTPRGPVVKKESYKEYADRLFQENGNYFTIDVDKELAELDKMLKGGAEAGINTSEAIQRLRAYRKKLLDLKKARQEKINVDVYGDADASKVLNTMVQYKKQEARIQAGFKERENTKAYNEARLNYQLASGETYSTRASASADQFSEYKKLLEQAADETEQARKAYEKAKAARNQLNDKVKNKEIDLGAAYSAMKPLNANVTATGRIFQKAHQKLISMNETYQLMKKQNEQVQNEENKFYSDKIQNLDREIRLQQLVLQGRDSLIKRQKILNELNNKGYTLTNQQLDEMIRKQSELGALKLRQQQQEEGHSLVAQSMRLMGQERQAMEYEAIRTAKKQKGADLDQQQLTRVRSLVGLKYELSKIGGWNLQTTGTLTNELAARGGFNSSVHTDNKYDVNQQIYNQTHGIYQTLQTIPQLLRNMGVIQ